MCWVKQSSVIRVVSDKWVFLTPLLALSCSSVVNFNGALVPNMLPTFYMYIIF